MTSTPYCATSLDRASSSAAALRAAKCRRQPSAATAAAQAKPIPFDAPDAQPVGLIFVLLVPERATDLHLQILSELAQMFSDQAFRKQLFAAATAADMHRLITEWRADA